MSSYFQPGLIWDYFNDTADTVPASTFVVIKKSLGFIANDIPPGELGAARMQGAIEWKKPDGEEWTLNAILNWDETNQQFTVNSADVGAVALAAKAAASGDKVGTAFITPKLDDSSVKTYTVAATDDAGNGTVEGDTNATDFTAQLGTTYWQVDSTDLVTVMHKLVAYLYIGPKDVRIGVGGNYVTTAGDFAAVGTADHNLLNNRSLADQHPTSAITGLDAAQTTQDNNIAQNTSDIAQNTSDIAQNATDIAQNTTDISDHVSAPDPHPQYEFEYPSIVMWGPCSNFTMGTGGSPLVNYPEAKAFGGALDSAYDQAAGTITVPEGGAYQISLLLVGQQGNSTKEESMFLEIAVDGVWSIAAVFEVATDKTDWRSFAATATRAYNGGEVLQLRGRATAGMGTFNVNQTTFEIHKQTDLV